jgi:hypothetical protein
MNLSSILLFFNRNKTNILLAALCVLLAWLIINWFRYLNNNYFIFKGTNNINQKEGFKPNTEASITFDNPNTPLTTHSVDLPLNTNYKCANFCGPKQTCSKTPGIQCSTDVDCWQFGCQSLLKPPTKTEVEKLEDEPKPDNDAGILTYNQTPQYSFLTTDIGTNASIINQNAELDRPYAGIPVWENTYNKQAQMIDDELAYKYSAEPEKYKTTPFYPVSTTITGLFYDIGPTPSNAILS